MNANKFLAGRPCIYGIYNVVNHKIYVGKTKCLYKRTHQYIYAFRTSNLDHLNEYLFRAMVKVGFDKFEIFPLEFCNIDELSDKELAWMIQLRSLERNHGYNLRFDSSTGMTASTETSIKISNNLKRQWVEGVRDGHSEKLKISWASDPGRRAQQGGRFSKTLTKYEYTIQHPDGLLETCKYARLQELGLQNVMANFHKTGSNSTIHRGFRITRYPVGEA